MANPILFGTEKDYAWDAWRTAFDAGKLQPSRDRFETWWNEVAQTVQWQDTHQLFSSAWSCGVQDRNAQCTAGYDAWWQEILDKQPVIGVGSD